MQWTTKEIETMEECARIEGLAHKLSKTLCARAQDTQLEQMFQRSGQLAMQHLQQMTQGLGTAASASGQGRQGNAPFRTEVGTLGQAPTATPTAGASLPISDREKADLMMILAKVGASEASRGATESASQQARQMFQQMAQQCSQQQMQLWQWLHAHQGYEVRYATSEQTQAVATVIQQCIQDANQINA
ncbi:MAG: spore coat protein [Firmicutes bacterium]|nr:spore coat protein [Bacillota bacterium]